MRVGARTAASCCLVLPRFSDAYSLPGAEHAVAMADEAAKISGTDKAQAPKETEVETWARVKAEVAAERAHRPPGYRTSLSMSKRLGASVRQHCLVCAICERRWGRGMVCFGSDWQLPRSGGAGDESRGAGQTGSGREG